ncbi:unnamed protein product [Rodentolepis nana]|uniref:Miff domain-containing protein n=1 Tax=Rodentolepis nana TaxID=102285 RepID=A0A0R3TLF1_RODNA|nr:unnamed protein product [Rodentolepis nana]
MIDLDYATDISNRMQVPSRLSLAMPEFSSADNISSLNSSSGVIVSGSNLSHSVLYPYDLPVSRPSLEPPPESIVLSQVDYPDIDRVTRSQYTPIDPSRENSNLSLFNGRHYVSPNATMDDDRTLVDVDANGEGHSKPAVCDQDLEGMETRMQELVSRVAALETTMARQQRRDLLILLLIGAYVLAKLGRPFLRN